MVSFYVQSQTTQALLGKYVINKYDMHKTSIVYVFYS